MAAVPTPLDLTVELLVEAIEVLAGRGEIIFHAEPAAFTMKQAAEASSHSIDTLERAADRGELKKRYANSKPVIEPDELRRWIKSLPTKRPRR